MLDQIYKAEQVWNTIQEPRCLVYMPVSYMLLLSALDKGWQIENIELAPTWDQYGFVYLVLLHCQTDNINQQIILPKNSVVESLLFDGAGSVYKKTVHNYREMQA
jgi:hypothetical protein